MTHLWRRKLQRVEVYWIDPVQGGDDWIEKNDDHFTPAPQRCVGYLVERTRDLVKIADATSYERDHWAGTWAIPRGCVLDIVPLTGRAPRVDCKKYPHGEK